MHIIDNINEKRISFSLFLFFHLIRAHSFLLLSACWFNHLRQYTCSIGHSLRHTWAIASTKRNRSKHIFYGWCIYISIKNLSGTADYIYLLAFAYLLTLFELCCSNYSVDVHASARGQGKWNEWRNEMASNSKAIDECSHWFYASKVCSAFACFAGFLFVIEDSDNNEY